MFTQRQRSLAIDEVWRTRRRFNDHIPVFDVLQDAVEGANLERERRGLVAGIGFETLASFGGALNVFLGLVVWWLLFFAGALVYVACLFPGETR